MVIVGVLYALKSHKGQIYGGQKETMIEKVVVSSKHKGINNNLMVVVGGGVVCVYGGWGGICSQLGVGRGGLESIRSLLVSGRDWGLGRLWGSGGDAGEGPASH